MSTTTIPTQIIDFNIYNAPNTQYDKKEYIVLHPDTSTFPADHIFYSICKSDNLL